MLARCKYQAQLDEYARFSKKMGLKQERERIYLDKQGRVAPESKSVMKLYPKELIENANRDILQYERYKTILGKDIGSLADFGQIKYNDIEKWKFVSLDFKRRERLVNNPELKLPNAEKAILPDSKFTNYLLGGENKKGLAKGKTFTSRLGYDISNWNLLQKELREGALKYPATHKGETEYGIKYEQQMILYGKKNTPANVVVGWMYKPNGTISMSSAYIKEVE